MMVHPSLHNAPNESKTPDCSWGKYGEYVPSRRVRGGRVVVAILLFLAIFSRMLALSMIPAVVLGPKSLNPTIPDAMGMGLWFGALTL
eukprot:scaffold179009_cov40-Attheya_sp.AAC.1